MELRVATTAMGTRFELVLHGPDRAHLLAAGEAALDVIESEHRRLSRFDPASLVSHLRRTAGGRPVPVDRDTWALFADALAVRRASGGVFDPTRGTGGSEGGIELDAATGTVRLTSPAVALDFGAIAKGHALDLAVRAIRAVGVDRAFLHGGASSGHGIGRPPGRAGWRVAPAQDRTSAPVLDLVDGAFSVSSEGGQRHVCVVGPSGRLADAWATSLALDPDSGGLPDAAWRAWILEPGLPWSSIRPRSESLA